MIDDGIEKGHIKDSERSYNQPKEVKSFKSMSQGMGLIIALICKAIFTLIFGLVVYLQVRKANKLSEMIGYTEKKSMPSLWRFFNTEFKFNKFWRKRESLVVVVMIPLYFCGFAIHNFYFIGIAVCSVIGVILIVAWRTATNYLKSGMV